MVPLWSSVSFYTCLCWPAPWSILRMTLCRSLLWKFVLWIWLLYSPLNFTCLFTLGYLLGSSWLPPLGTVVWNIPDQWVTDVESSVYFLPIFQELLSFIAWCPSNLFKIVLSIYFCSSINLLSWSFLNCSTLEDKSTLCHSILARYGGHIMERTLRLRSDGKGAKPYEVQETDEM